MYLPKIVQKIRFFCGLQGDVPQMIFEGCLYSNPECCRITGVVDPHHFGNLDPHPDPHPHQIKIRIRIRIKEISWIRNRIQIRINLQMKSQNV
jgi:hypothetical protein